MPADDLILNVRQIGGFPPALNAVPSDALVLQRGGLGGPYLEISPVALVGTALQNGGDMAIGGKLSAAAVQGGSLQFSNGAFGKLSAQGACFNQFDAQWGSINGDPIATIRYVDSLFASGVTSINGVLTGDVILTVWDVKGAAPLFSPRFTGQPFAPTPASNSCSNRLATTAFVHGTVMNYLQGFLNGQAFVSTFNGRTGDVVLTAADITAAGTGEFAPLDSPDFTGLPTGPTAPLGTQTGQLATTAYVMNAVEASTAGVSSFNTRTGAVTFTSADLAAVNGATLASPTFTGTPSAPTAPLGTSTSQLATTAFVLNELGGLAAGVVSFNGRSGAVTLNSTDISNAGGALAGNYVNTFNGRSGAVSLIANDVSAVGGLINPNVALTGTPTAPTATAGTSTTQLATCAFVAAAIAAIGAGVVTFNGRAGAVTLSPADVSGAGGPYQTVAAMATRTNRNLLINGLFQINQRGFGGGPSGGAGIYTIDRWKAGASGVSVTFATNGVATVAAGTVLQLVEAINVVGGTYTLSWTGTAQARINSGAYGPSPITAALPAMTAISVEFNTGTFSQPQLELGSVPTPYDWRQGGQELLLCQRYFQTGYMQNAALSSGAGSYNQIFNNPVVMRASPSVIPTWNAQIGCTGALSVGVTGPYAIQFGQNVTVAAGTPFNAWGTYTADADL